jgi:hypothetical protein
MRHVINTKFLNLVVSFVLAMFLLFELVPPVTQANLVERKLVPVTELWAASFESSDLQNTSLVRRVELTRQNATALGLDEQLWWRTGILLGVLILGLYFLLPTQMRILRPFADTFDTVAMDFKPYRAFTKLYYQPVFFVATLLMIGGLIVQKDLLKSPENISTLTKGVSSAEQNGGAGHKATTANPSE